MAELKSYLNKKRILAVDDEEDILETIEDILEDSQVDRARDYNTASKKIKENKYDLAILDIMGVDGLKLLEEAVDRGIPSVILTAHAVNPETLISSIQKGAIAYIPKEKLPELDDLLGRILSAHEKGEPQWKLLFELLGDYLDQRFGPDWKTKENAFWSEFSRSYKVSKKIRERIR